MVIKSIIEEFNLLINEFSSILSKTSNKTIINYNMFGLNKTSDLDTILKNILNNKNSEYTLQIPIYINGFSNLGYLITIYSNCISDEYINFELLVEKIFSDFLNYSHDELIILFEEKYINKTGDFFIGTLREQLFKLLPSIQEDSNNLQGIVPEELVNFIKNISTKFDKNLKEIHGDNFSPLSGLRDFSKSKQTEEFYMIKSKEFKIDIEITVAKVNEYFIINGLMNSDCEDYKEYVTYSYLEMEEIRVSINNVSQCFPKLEAFMIECEKKSDVLITNCVAESSKYYLN